MERRGEKKEKKRRSYRWVTVSPAVYTAQSTRSMHYTVKSYLIPPDLLYLPKNSFEKEILLILPSQLDCGPWILDGVEPCTTS